MARTYEELLQETQAAKAIASGVPAEEAVSTFIPLPEAPPTAPKVAALVAAKPQKKPAGPPAPKVTKPELGVKAPREEKIATPPVVEKLVTPPEVLREIDYKKFYNTVLPTPFYRDALRQASRDMGIDATSFEEAAQKQGVSLEAIHEAKMKGRSYDEIAQAGRSRGVLGFMPVAERNNQFLSSMRSLEGATKGQASDVIDLKPAKESTSYVAAGTHAELPEVSKPGEHGYEIARVLVEALKNDKEQSHIYDLYGRSMSTGATQKYVAERTKQLMQRAGVNINTPDADAKVDRLRKQAINEVLAYKTIGQWTPAVVMQLPEVTEGARAPGFFEAMAPNIELIGINNKGQAIFRQESPLGVTLRLIDIPQAAVTGMLTGEGAGRGIQTGANLLEYAMEKTEDSSPWVKYPARTLGFGASIFFPDLLGVAGGVEKLGKFAVREAKIIKHTPKVLELLDEAAKARAANDFATAHRAESQIRELLPTAADHFDQYDAATAQVAVIKDPKQDIANEDLASLIAAQIPTPEAHEFAASRSWLHPSIRREAMSVKRGGKVLEKLAPDEAYDTQRLLNRVAAARQSYLDNAPKTLVDYAKMYVRGAAKDILTNLPDTILEMVDVKRLPALSAADVDEIAKIVEAEAPLAQTNFRAFQKAVESRLANHPKFGAPEYTEYRNMLRSPGKNSMLGRIGRKMKEIGGKTVEELQAPDLELFGRAKQAIEKNNQVRGMAADLLREKLAADRKIVVRPSGLFDDIAPVGPDGKPIRLSAGALQFIAAARRLNPEAPIEHLYAVAAVFDKAVQKLAKKLKQDPYLVWAERAPALMKATPEEVAAYGGKVARGGPPPSVPPTPEAPTPPPEAPPTPPAVAAAEVPEAAPTPPAVPTPPVAPPAGISPGRQALMWKPEIPAGTPTRNITDFSEAKKLLQAAKNGELPPGTATASFARPDGSVGAEVIAIGDVRITWGPTAEGEFAAFYVVGAQRDVVRAPLPKGAKRGEKVTAVFDSAEKARNAALSKTLAYMKKARADHGLPVINDVPDFAAIKPTTAAVAAPGAEFDDLRRLEEEYAAAQAAGDTARMKEIEDAVDRLADAAAATPTPTIAEPPTPAPIAAAAEAPVEAEKIIEAAPKTYYTKYEAPTLAQVQANLAEARAQELNSGRAARGERPADLEKWDPDSSEFYADWALRSIAYDLARIDAQGLKVPPDIMDDTHRALADAQEAKAEVARLSDEEAATQGLTYGELAQIAPPSSALDQAISRELRVESQVNDIRNGAAGGAAADPRFTAVNAKAVPGIRSASLRPDDKYIVVDNWKGRAAEDIPVRGKPKYFGFKTRAEGEKFIQQQIAEEATRRAAKAEARPLFPELKPEAAAEEPDVLKSISVRREARLAERTATKQKRQVDVLIARLAGESIAAEFEDIPEVFRVNARSRLARANKALAARTIDEAEHGRIVQSVTDGLEEQKRLRQAKAAQDKVRGPYEVRHRLLQAAQQGKLDERGVDLADWFIQQNPRMAGELGVSIRGAKAAEAEGGVRGFYSAMDQIVTVLDNSDELTATHEILHHTERMLSADLQAAIRKEWTKRVTATMKGADTETRALLEDALTGTNIKGLEDAVRAGKLPYELVSPSEFWAVNASKIVSGRYAAFNKGLAAKAKQWLTEFVQKVKSVFGFQSGAPLIRGLDAVIKGDGTFVSDGLLSARSKYLSAASVQVPAVASKIEAAAPGITDLRRAMLEAAGDETAFDPKVYAERKDVCKLTGHCNAAAYIVQKKYGGELLSAKVRGETHVWNRLPDGTQVDLTGSQYGGDGFHPVSAEGKIVPPRATVNPRFKKFEAEVNRALQALTPSGITEEAARQIETPEFKRWFGDSKAVDDQGKPLVVYHGTTADFTRMRPSKEGALGSGIYLTPSPERASAYAEEAGGSVMPLYVSAKRPLILRTSPGQDPMVEALVTLGEPREKAERIVEKAYDQYGYVRKQVETRARAQGYDAIFQYQKDGTLNEIVVFEPTQVKSATANVGTFSPTEPSILRSIEAPPPGEPPVPPVGAEGIEEPPRAPSGVIRLYTPSGDVQGIVQTMAMGRDVIKLFENADVSTVIRGAGVSLRRIAVDADDMGKITNWLRNLGIQVSHQYGEFIGDSDQVEKAEVAFGHALERYVMEGTSESPEIQAALGQIKDMMLNLYKKVSDPVVGANLPADVRGVFDKVLADAGETPPETVKSIIRRRMMGGEVGDAGILETLSVEAQRKGIPATSVEDLREKFDAARKKQIDDVAALRKRYDAARKQTKGSVALDALRQQFDADLERTVADDAVHLTFPVPVLGKAEWSLDDLARAQAEMDMGRTIERARAEGLKVNLRAETRRTGALAEEETPVEKIRSALIDRENDRPITKDAKSVLRKVTATFFGGDVIEERAARYFPPEMRKALDTVDRVVSESIGDTITLVNDAIRSGQDRVLIRYLAGKTDIRRLAGRPIVSAGHDYMGSVLGMFRRMFESMTPEEAAAIADLADIMNGPTKDISRWVATFGFEPDEVLSLAMDPKVAAKKFAASEMAAKARGEALSRALNKILYLAQVGEDSSIGTALSKALREAVGAPRNTGARVWYEMRLVETLSYLTGKTSRKIGEAEPELFKGTSEEAARLLLGSPKIQGSIAHLYGEEAMRRVAVLIGGYGSADLAKTQLVHLDLGLTPGAREAFESWAAGRAWDPQYAEEIQRVVDRYGYNPDLVADAILDVNVYIPREARERLAKALARSTYRPGQDIGTARTINSLYRYMKTRMTRGSFFIRQRYYMMNTIDHFMQMGMTHGFGVAAASTARIVAQDLTTLLFWPQLVEAARKLPAGERIPVDIVERARAGLQKLGDRAAHRIGEMFSASKYRIEVNPILEGLEGGFRAGDKVHSYKTVRQVAVQEGVFASFDTRQLANAIEREGSLVINEQLTKFSDVISSTQGISTAQGGGRIRNFLADWQHTVGDTAEAWGERERLGAMVTLMEAGHDPRTAARLVIDALYDYSQTMTKGDRSLLVGIMFPFWAFQKNANQQIFNLMFSPWGAYRMMCLERARERTADLLAEILYNDVGTEYDLDVKSMPPELQDTYYSIVTAFERAYDGNPPPEAKRALRMLLTNRARDVEQGKLVEISPELVHMRESGVFAEAAIKFAPFVQLRPSKSNRMTYMRDREGIPIPYPRTEIVQAYNRLLADQHSYLEYYLPESTIETGMKHIAQLMAAYMMIGSMPVDWLERAGQGVGLYKGETLTQRGADEVKLTNIMNTFFDPARSPFLGPLLASATTDYVPPKKVASALGAGAAAVTKIHPMIGKTMDDMFGTTFLRVPEKNDPFVIGALEGDITNLTPEQIAEIKRLQEEYPDIGKLRDQRYYIQGGVWTHVFENSPLGELNAMLLNWETSPGERADIRGKTLAWARAVLGADVAEVSAEKTMRAEEPTKLKKTKGI